MNHKAVRNVDVFNAPHFLAEISGFKLDLAVEHLHCQNIHTYPQCRYPGMAVAIYMYS